MLCCDVVVVKTAVGEALLAFPALPDTPPVPVPVPPPVPVPAPPPGPGPPPDPGFDDPAQDWNDSEDFLRVVVVVVVVVDLEGEFEFPDEVEF